MGGEEGWKKGSGFACVWGGMLSRCLRNATLCRYRRAPARAARSPGAGWYRAAQRCQVRSRVHQTEGIRNPARKEPKFNRVARGKRGSWSQHGLLSSCRCSTRSFLRVLVRSRKGGNKCYDVSL